MGLLLSLSWEAGFQHMRPSMQEVEMGASSVAFDAAIALLNDKERVGLSASGYDIFPGSSWPCLCSLHLCMLAAPINASMCGRALHASPLWSHVHFVCLCAAR